MADFSVEVAYATADEQVIVSVAVPQDCTVLQAIQKSGIQQQFPEIDLNTQAVGIFGKKVDSSAGLRAGDRIEIYRPLLIDPKEARRRRAAMGPESGAS